jgi:hypothetical protein
MEALINVTELYDLFVYVDFMSIQKREGMLLFLLAVHVPHSFSKLTSPRWAPTGLTRGQGGRVW